MHICVYIFIYIYICIYTYIYTYFYTYGCRVGGVRVALGDVVAARVESVRRAAESAAGSPSNSCEITPSSGTFGAARFRIFPSAEATALTTTSTTSAPAPPQFSGTSRAARFRVASPPSSAEAPALTPTSTKAPPNAR